MISEKIKKDTAGEFINIRKELQIDLSGDFDIDNKKPFLQEHVSNVVIFKAKLLVDTLINYLMKEGTSILEKADIDIQNSFYKEDFRKRMNIWQKKPENQLSLDPSIVKFSMDPRIVNGLIASGITFILGSVISTIAFLPTMAFGALVFGIVTLIASIFVFKLAFNKSSSKARDAIKKDVETYLKQTEIQVNNWLKNTIKAFAVDFSAFCKQNGFEYTGDIL